MKQLPAVHKGGKQLASERGEPGANSSRLIIEEGAMAYEIIIRSQRSRERSFDNVSTRETGQPRLVANNNELIWPPIPFGEGWYSG